MDSSSPLSKIQRLWANMHLFFYPVLLLCCLWAAIPVFGPQWFSFQTWQYPTLYVLLILTYLPFCSRKLYRRNAKSTWHYVFQVFQVIIAIPIGYYISIFFLIFFVFSLPSYSTPQLFLVSRGIMATPLEYGVYRPVGFFYNIYVGSFTGAVNDSEYAHYFDSTARWQNMLYFFVSLISLVACLYLVYRILLFLYRFFIAKTIPAKNNFE